MLVVETVNVTHTLICMYVHHFFSRRVGMRRGRLGDTFLGLFHTRERDGCLTGFLPSCFLRSRTGTWFAFVLF